MPICICTVGDPTITAVILVSYIHNKNLDKKSQPSRFSSTYCNEYPVVKQHIQDKRAYENSNNQKRLLPVKFSRFFFSIYGILFTTRPSWLVYTSADPHEIICGNDPPALSLCCWPTPLTRWDMTNYVFVRTMHYHRTDYWDMAWGYWVNSPPPRYFLSLQWRHNGCNGASNHQPHDYLLNRLLRCRSKKASKLRVTGLCAGNSPVTGEFPAQMASNVENVSIWWRHHVFFRIIKMLFTYWISRSYLTGVTAP